MIRQRSIRIWLGAAMTAAAVQSGAMAQVTIDVTKITCEQFLDFRVADPQIITVWMSGYFHGRRGSTTVEPQKFKDYYAKLKDACFEKDTVNRPVLDIAEKLISQD